MSRDTIRLTNKAGEHVTIPKFVAMDLFLSVRQEEEKMMGRRVAQHARLMGSGGRGRGGGVAVAADRHLPAAIVAAAAGARPRPGRGGSSTTLVMSTRQRQQQQQQQGLVADGGVAVVPALELTATALPAREPPPLNLDSLQCCKACLVEVKAYAMLPRSQRSPEIPRPINAPLEDIVTKFELDLVLRATKGKYITPLTELAILLQFEELSNLCSAFIYETIEKISKESPDTMVGSERIRAFMNIPNDWTEEESLHLGMERDLAKELDPESS